MEDTSLQGTFPFSYDPSIKDTSIKRTSLLVPNVSVIEELYCILVVYNVSM